MRWLALGLLCRCVAVDASILWFAQFRDGDCPMEKKESYGRLRLCEDRFYSSMRE